jgi:hypothetical protein
VAISGSVNNPVPVHPGICSYLGSGNSINRYQIELSQQTQYIQLAVEYGNGMILFQLATAKL